MKVPRKYLKRLRTAGWSAEFCHGLNSDGSIRDWRRSMHILVKAKFSKL